MRFSKISLPLLVVTVIICINSPGKAWALLDGLFGKSPSAAAPPQFYIHDEDSFKANTKSFHQIPFNDPKLEFDILLPKDWTAETLPQIPPSDQGQEVLSEVAHFKSPFINTLQAVVSIQSTRLSHEISAENWLKNHIFTTGYSLQEKVTPAGDKKATAAFISVADGKSTYTYTSLQINGDTAVMARFDVPLQLKTPMDSLIRQSISSFRMILSADASVEAQKTFSLADALKFTYPESWTLHYPDLKDPHNMSVQIHNEPQPGKVEGLIRFVAVRRTPQTSLNREIASLKKYFDGFLGIEFKKMASSGTAPAYNRFLFSRYEVYQVSAKKKDTADQELRLVILGDKEWYIFAFLLTPTETDNLYTWARNTRTFDLIIRNLK